MSEQFVRNLSKNCYFLEASAKLSGGLRCFGRRIHFQQTKSSYLIGDTPSNRSKLSPADAMFAVRSKRISTAPKRRFPAQTLQAVDKSVTRV